MWKPKPDSQTSIYEERASNLLRALAAPISLRTTPGTLADDLGCLAALGSLSALAYLLLVIA